MKLLRILTLTVALVGFFGAVGAPTAKASVSFSFFYDSLGAHGDWAEIDDYGYCWRPRGVDPDWQPYTDGYWAYTDAGWTWVSYEDWGGIVYHYGRWTLINGEGWCWVPGYEWGPAWVSWRYSDDYVGWAPLPPRARFSVSVGFSSWVDAEFDIGPRYYSFCETRHFGNPVLRPVIVDRRQNITIIEKTTNITNITINKNKKVVYNGGPDVDVISRKANRPVQRLNLVRETTVEGKGIKNARKRDNQLVVTAPEVTPAEIAPEKRPKRKISKDKIDTGWAGITDPTTKEKIREKQRADAKGLKPEQAPAKPVDDAVVTAKIKDAEKDRKERPNKQEANPLSEEEKKARREARKEDKPESEKTVSEKDQRKADRPKRPELLQVQPEEKPKAVELNKPDNQTDRISKEQRQQPKPDRQIDEPRREQRKPEIQQEEQRQQRNLERQQEEERQQRNLERQQEQMRQQRNLERQQEQMRQQRNLERQQEQTRQQRNVERQQEQARPQRNPERQQQVERHQRQQQPVQPQTQDSSEGERRKKRGQNW